LVDSAKNGGFRSRQPAKRTKQPKEAVYVSGACSCHLRSNMHTWLDRRREHVKAQVVGEELESADILANDSRAGLGLTHSF